MELALRSVCCYGRATLEAVSCRAAQLERELRQQTEGTRHAHQAEGGRLRLRLEDCERELERLTGEGRRTEEVGREREAELGRVQALLQSLETDNREQVQLYIVNHKLLLVSSCILTFPPFSIEVF